ncbi:MAG: efflux transporter outer membrane subunit [Woeseiaceae bacterium]
MRTPKLLLWLIAAGITLTGCYTAPPRDEVEQEVSEAVRQQPPETPEQWALADAGTVQAGWIESFNDPVLTALVLEAQANNRDLAAAAANVDRAWALARQAGAALVPDVSLGRSAVRSGGFDDSRPTVTTLNVAAQVSWEADVWGRVRSSQRSAVAGAQAVAADFRSAQESLASATAKAYFSAIEANTQADIARESVRILEETQRLVDVRYENGMGSSQDVSLARSDLASARERLVTLDGSIRDALRALEALLGRYPGADLKVRETLPVVPPPPPAGLPADLLQRRPDLVAAERRVAAAFNATNQARAARLPTITLTGEVGGVSNSLSDLLSSSNLAWAAGANLLAPLFDGGRRREGVTIATAEQEQALAAFGQAAIGAFNEIETNLDQGTVLQQRIAELEIAASEAGNAYRIARVRYDEGEEDLLNVLTIQQRGISARSSQSAVERLLLEQRVNLNLALGGGWTN